ncbi:hypothetical protein MBLNU457_4746t2 [Dothideomycetes sp. NU457]
MAAKHTSRFFGLDAQDSLRVTRWLALNHQDRETFYASFVNWACGVAHRLHNATRAVPEDEAGVIESLRELPMRPQVLMRNMAWYLDHRYRRDANKPHEGPIRIANGGW